LNTIHITKNINHAPSWYFHDELLVNVIKSALEVLKAAVATTNSKATAIFIRNFSATQAYLLTGVYRYGGRYEMDVPDSISPNDLFKAAECFKQAVAAAAAAARDDENVAFYTEKRRSTLKEAVKRRRLQDTGVRLYIDRWSPNAGNMSVGSWVVVKDLEESKAGSAMNGKLGYITGPSSLKEQGFIVEVQGVDGTKSIKGCNLDPVPIEESWLV